MKKLSLLVSAALLSVASYAVPQVDPTPGMATVVFSVPEAECTTTMNFVGDVQGYDPTADGLPVAELVEGQWYKLVLPLNGGAAQGKICPRSLTGAGTWNYQGKTYTVDEASSSIAWASIVDDYGTQNKIVLTDGCAGGVVYINVLEWQANFCDMPNPAGEASFTVTFEIPETVDTNDIAIAVYGQGTGTSWSKLGDLEYDGVFEKFTGTAEVPEGCSYKYVISYKGGDEIYMKGDNLKMPYGLVANNEVTEWVVDPFTPSFTVTVNVNDQGMGSVTGGGKYQQDSVATLTATPSVGYQFANWTDDGGTIISTDNQVEILVTKDTTVTANFEVKNIKLSIGSDGCATIYSDSNLKVPADVEVTGYTYESFSDALFPGDAITEGEILPANRGYIVKAQPGKYVFEYTSQQAGSEPKFESELTGWTSDKTASEVSGTIYGFGTYDGKLGFYQFGGDIVPAGKAVYVKSEN